LPTPGDTFSENGLQLEVLTVRGRRVGRVRIERRHGDESDGRQEEAAVPRSA
jgi:CBS domain containing-hemolysin-like protein